MVSADEEQGGAVDEGDGKYLRITQSFYLTLHNDADIL